MAIINWSGDIGVHGMCSGNPDCCRIKFDYHGFYPYWTTDIGGFFRPGHSQYTDEKYHELLTRWYQWGAFNPIFRMHGYQTETEPWKYGEKWRTICVKCWICVTGCFLIFIPKLAGYQNGSTIMRHWWWILMVMKQPWAVSFEYMFGKSILVAPVTGTQKSVECVFAQMLRSWFDFWTKALFGLDDNKADTPLDRFLFFCKIQDP